MKKRVLFLLFLCIHASICKGRYMERDHRSLDTLSQKHTRHFISINPVKYIIGMPNIHYGFQIVRGISVHAFSEVLAFNVLNNFDHPDMVSTIGVSFYPFLGDGKINQGFFINVNTSYIQYFNENAVLNSFANGVQIGYTYLMKNKLFLEPRILLNYVHQEKSFLPGFEVLLGLRF